MQTFRTMLPEQSAILTEVDGLAKYNEEYMHQLHGNSKCVLRPKTAQEVAQILAYCNGRKLAVVPQGGNTSLVGGSTPVFDEVVLSLERMNKIYGLSEYTGILTIQAGVVLQDAEKYCNDRGYTFPLDLGAKVPLFLIPLGLLPNRRQPQHKRGRFAFREVWVAEGEHGGP
jgi:FAD/FMN-containing dehydrogenase